MHIMHQCTNARIRLQKLQMYGKDNTMNGKIVIRITELSVPMPHLCIAKHVKYPVKKKKAGKGGR